MTRKEKLLFQKNDPRYLPAYSLNEAAQYLALPRTTLRSWVRGRSYDTANGAKFFQPLITLPNRASMALSFVNLVEAHVLGAIRREHEVPLPNVRRALRFIADRFQVEHPLADQQFETDRLDLFVQKLGQLINASQQGQLVMRSLIEAHLRRIERDKSGVAARLYPFTRSYVVDAPKVIVIDPYISFGRPVVAGTGIATSVIAERYKGGESVDALADDYGRSRPDIEEAIRCELQFRAA